MTRVKILITKDITCMVYTDNQYLSNSLKLKFLRQVVNLVKHHNGKILKKQIQCNVNTTCDACDANDANNGNYGNKEIISVVLTISVLALFDYDLIKEILDTLSSHGCKYVIKAINS